MSVVDTLVMAPLREIYAAIFAALPARFGVGPRLIGFSLAVNLVLLPLYLGMERASRELRGVREKVARDVARMKRHFHGRERYYYIRAVFRQYRYHPISALLGSGDLFVQIVVFASVYRYLAALPALAGASFGLIRDLGAPDHLLGPVHLLPLLMTAINAASAFAYVEDRGKRLQALALGLLFLLLLYRSPSGLVLYWTANNLFSWVRNLLARSGAFRRFAGVLTPLRTGLEQR